jgi:hypothetical protein
MTREDDYSRGFSAGWKAAMEYVGAGFPPSYTEVTPPQPPMQVDMPASPCDGCGPVCGNAMCPKRIQITS